MLMALDPAPDALLATASHALSDVTVHGQLACVVKVAFKVPRGMHGWNATGVTAYAHAPASPVCLTENARPPAVIAPERSAVSMFRATAYATVPLPEPGPPEPPGAQDALLPAVHAHESGAETAKVPDAASLL